MKDLRGPSVPPASGGRPRQLVLLLHGIGANGHDLISLADSWKEVLPDAEFFSPHGFERYDWDTFGGGRQWFSLYTDSTADLLNNIQQAYKNFTSSLDTVLRQRGLKDKDLALVGFSQGAMLALYTGLRRREPCGAVASFSGLLIESDDEWGFSKPPVFLAHGQEDTTVPFSSLEKAETLLKEKGVQVSTLARPELAHGIDEVEIAAAGEFLASQFKSAPKSK